MSIQKGLPTSKKVTISESETIEVKKLPLGKYAQLMLALKNMPSSVMTDLQSLDTQDQEKMIQTIFGAFGQAWGQVLDIVSIGSGVDRERLDTDETIGLDVGVALFIAIYEVNNLAQVVTNVKNAMSRPKE